MKLFPKKNKNFQDHHPDTQPPLDPMKLILETIDSCTDAKTEIKGNSVRFPDWNVSVVPEPKEMGANNAVINFHIACVDWDDVLFECCAGVGQDTRAAIGTACSSFLFACIQGIQLMQENEYPVPFETTFAGKPHSWNAYVSNTVGLGENIGTSNYWDLLQKHIVKRLGNQKMCYVKVYAAKCIDNRDGTPQITGECRIDDIPSKELSDIVAKEAEKWDVKQFSSQKQFFFIKQDENTQLPNAYSGILGRNELRKKVKTAIDMFQACRTDEEYDNLLTEMKKKLNDNTFAEECFSFMSEICAERAFSEEIPNMSEKISISVGGAEPVECYKNQLADYYAIGAALFSLFSEGIYGEETDKIYRRFIGASSIYSAVCKMRDKGSDLKNVRLTSLLFNTSADFEIR